MKKETLNQLRDFEIFVERMEAFVEDIKNDKEFKDAGFKISEMDLRDKNGGIYPIPENLEDYFDLWKSVLEAANENYRTPVEKREKFWLKEFFFDLYWNDVQGNAAYYQDEAFWVYFHDTKGICFDYPYENEDEN